MEKNIHRRNNPAGRLLTILLKAKSFKPQDQSTREAWCNIFGIESSNFPLFLRRLSQLMELPVIIQREYSYLPDLSKDLYLKWLPSIHNGFSRLNFESSFNGFTAHLNDSAMLGLEVCADQLSKHRPEKVYDQKELDDILSTTKKLLTEMEDGSINGELIQFIKKKLLEIIEAIEKYGIFGSKPIEDIVLSTYGAIAIDKELYTKTKNTKTGPDFWKILSRIATITTITLGALQIGYSTLDLLSEPYQGIVESSEKGLITVTKAITTSIK